MENTEPITRKPTGSTGDRLYFVFLWPVVSACPHMATADGTQAFAISQRPQQLLRDFPAFQAHDVVLHIVPGE